MEKICLILCVWSQVKASWLLLTFQRCYGCVYFTRIMTPFTSAECVNRPQWLLRGHWLRCDTCTRFTCT